MVKVVVVEILDKNGFIVQSFKFPKWDASEAMDYVMNQTRYDYTYGYVWFDDGTHQRYEFKHGQLEDFDANGNLTSFE